MKDNVLEFPKKQKAYNTETISMSRKYFDDLAWEVVELRSLKKLSLFERIFCWPYKKK